MPEPSSSPSEVPPPRPFDILSEQQASGKDLSSFLEENVYAKKGSGGDEAHGESVNRITHSKEPNFTGTKKDDLSKLVSLVGGFFDSTNDTSSSKGALSILEVAKSFNNTDIEDKESSTKSKQPTEEEMQEFWKLLQQVGGQWSQVAQNAKVKDIDPLAFMYYVGMEEAQSTPSSKRREHRFYPPIEVETLHDLHDALYLSTVSYMHTVEDITGALEDYEGSPWAMIYCDVTSLPGEPAHFICLKKEQEMIEERGFRFPWQPEEVLDVLMVVRGTKELADVLSDALIDTSDFKDGIAHGGILTSGKYLVDKHTELLKTLLKESKRDKIRLSLVGHSLGAGAAAIACIQFNELDFVEAKAVGFGCPPVLSKELSESAKDYITTVVCDSDVVPRLSGAAISNLVMNVMSTPYTDQALVDVSQILEAIQDNFIFKPSEEQKQGILQFLRKGIDEEFNKYKVDFEPLEVVLFPPGKCIHLYRDGSGITGSYVPCTFFNRIELNRTMVSDHTTSGGYDRVFHELMRTHLSKLHFTFRHNIEAVNDKS